MATNTLALNQPLDRDNFLTGLGTPAVMLMMLAMIVLPLLPWPWTFCLR